MPRKRRKKAAKPKQSPAMAAIVDYLKEHRKAEYRDVVDAVAKNGHKIFPVMYGRAQALLGIVRMRKRGAGGKRVAARRRRSTRTVARRAGRSRVRAGGLDQLKGFLADYEELRRERDALRDALEAAHRAIAKVVK